MLYPVVLLWDGGPSHRRVIVHDFLRTHTRLHVHRFPPYAPELNPDEFVWTKAKHALSNGAPHDLAQLGTRLRRALQDAPSGWAIRRQWNVSI